MKKVLLMAAIVCAAMVSQAVTGAFYINLSGHDIYDYEGKEPYTGAATAKLLQMVCVWVL